MDLTDTKGIWTNSDSLADVKKRVNNGDDIACDVDVCVNTCLSCLNKPLTGRNDLTASTCMTAPLLEGDGALLLTPFHMLIQI